MKLAPLTLLLVCAAPARADVAVPQPQAKKTWRDGCVVRLDAAARKLGLPVGARTTEIPLVRENGAPNPVTYVEFGFGDLAVTAGEDPESRSDEDWTRTVHKRDPLVGPMYYKATWFRRLHNRFGKIEGEFSQAAAREFKLAVDDCLKMGEPK